MDELTKYLLQEKVITDEQLSKFFKSQLKQAQNYPESFQTMVKQISSLVLRGGKRVRPLLLRLAYRLGGGQDYKLSIKASLFVELIHTFLLVHDDIADRDLKRYGGPTLEVAFNNWFSDKFGQHNPHVGITLGLIAGDHLRTLASLALYESGANFSTISQCEQYMHQILRDTVVGWTTQYGLNFESISENQEADFMIGLEMVTSRYTFTAPLMLGLILAGRQKEMGEALTAYAHHVGIAFQVHDDVLGVFGDTNETGKPVGNDLREGKKTLLVLKAYERSNHKDREFIKTHLGRELNKADVIRFQQIITNTQSLHYSQDLAQKHVQLGKSELEKVKTNNVDALQCLHQLSDFVIHRKY